MLKSETIYDEGYCLQSYEQSKPGLLMRTVHTILTHFETYFKSTEYSAGLKFPPKFSLLTKLNKKRWP